MTFALLDTVVLDRDLPEQGLRKGDLGAVVAVYELDGLEVEFVAASGKTQAVITLTDRDVRAVGDGDLIAVRRLDRSAGSQPDSFRLRASLVARPARDRRNSVARAARTPFPCRVRVRSAAEHPNTYRFSSVREGSRSNRARGGPKVLDRPPQRSR